MNSRTLTQTTAVASTYNNSDIWTMDSFRFKNHDDIGKHELFQLRNADLIQKRDDEWTTTTWEWTDEAPMAIRMSMTTPVGEASDEQLDALSGHAELILSLPRTDDFLASEYDLIGQNIQTLSSNNLIEQIDTVGQLGVWTLTDYTLRLLTSLEAAEMRVEGNPSNAVIADD